MAQFLEQLDAGISLDQLVVEAPSFTAFQFRQLGRRDGVCARKHQRIDARVISEVLQQFTVFRAPRLGVRGLNRHGCVKYPKIG